MGEVNQSRQPDHELNLGVEGWSKLENAMKEKNAKTAIVKAQAKENP